MVTKGMERVEQFIRMEHVMMVNGTRTKQKVEALWKLEDLFLKESLIKISRSKEKSKYTKRGFVKSMKENWKTFVIMEKAN